MRRLTSPSALFALWTLMFLLPALPVLLHTHGHVMHAAMSPALQPAGSFAALAALMPVLRFAPLSYPLFAIVYALWPLIARRSLDAVLGRWQFGLATVPAIVSVFIGATVMSWSRTGPALPQHFAATARGLVVLEWIFLIVATFWILSVALFAFNVFRTVRGVPHVTATR